MCSIIVIVYNHHVCVECYVSSITQCNYAFYITMLFPTRVDNCVQFLYCIVLWTTATDHRNSEFVVPHEWYLVFLTPSLTYPAGG